MRIILKKTKVLMEFFKDIEIPDVLVGTVGITIVISVLFPNLPYRMEIAPGIAVLFGISIIPIGGDKGYWLIHSALKYRTRYRAFKGEPAKKGEAVIKDITSSIDIDGSFIEYGGECYGIVISIPDTESEFYTEAR